MQPTTLGRYRIVGVLGRGGMGVVYEGHDPQIDRAVAIKTIALDALNEQEKALFEQRFRAEMRSAGRLQHHNIAALYDTGRDGGTAYIVMERVTGHDLKWHLAAGQRFSVAQALDITLQLLTALEFAHQRQVIHRDVKPANLMLQADGVVKLCDFGVARLADADATRTQGMVVGSLRYASPEQILGRPIDARTDVFATGVLLFELLTGELPFKGQSDAEILHRITTDPAPSPRLINPDIAVDIDAAVQRALAKKPGDRFASAAEFARALGASTLTSPGSLPGLTPASAGVAAATMAPVRGKSRWLWAAGGAAMLAALGVWALLRPAPATVVAGGPPPPAPVAPSVATPPAAQAPTPLPAVLAPAATAPALGAAQASAAATQPALPPAKPASLLPADGAWHGQLACGPVLSRPGSPGTEAFTAELAIDIQGQRIRWTRNTAVVSETVAGTFDAQGRFSAEGQGARKDRAEIWREQASGAFVPKTRRIEGRVQILRLKDQSVARECTLLAQRGAAPAVAASASPRAPSAAAGPTVLALMQGAWRGRLACGATLSKNLPRPDANAFNADLAIDVAGSRITLLRDQSDILEKTVGTLDGQGRFSANGYGEHKKHAGGWVVLASGGFVPKAKRIEASVQILRMSDSGVARECSLVATRP